MVARRIPAMERWRVKVQKRMKRRTTYRGGLDDLLQWSPKLLHGPRMRTPTRKMKAQRREEGVGTLTWEG
jgi:hypothetical protein